MSEAAALRWGGRLPLAPAHTSTALGWEHIEAHRYTGLRCAELELPPVNRHFLSAHLLRPCQVETRWGGQVHRARSVPGNAMLMAAGQASAWHCSAAIDELLVFLDPAVVEAVAAELDGGRFELREGVGLVDPVLTDIAHRLLAEIEAPGIGTRLFADTMAQSLALQLLRRHSTLGAAASAARLAMTARQLRLATDFIESHLDAGLTLGAISAAPGMSPFRFARAFRQAVGQSPRQYVIGRRVEKAKELLRAGDGDLAEVANRVGFATQSHFTSVFRNRCGVTPKRFRDRHRV